MSPAENVSTILNDLYAGTLEDVAWNRAMIRISDFVGASGANLVAVNLVTGHVLCDESHRIDPSLATAYRDHWSSKDILIGPLLKSPVGEPTPDYKLAPLEVWEGCELFNELAIPFDLPYVLPTLLHKSAGKLVALSLKTSRRHGPFRADEVQRLRMLIPHIRRALEIKDRLALSHIRADALAKSLDNLSFGVLILDERGRVIETSSIAQQLTGPATGIQHQPDGTLRLREPAETELHRWIVAGTPPPDNIDGLLKAPRPGAQPISILVTALPRKTTSWMTGDPRWMLLLFDPERRVPVSTELLVRDLGISKREAQVAALLMSGYDLASIAPRLRISSNTVRTHVKAIFSKTGLSSQAELIRRIANGPAVVM